MAGRGWHLAICLVTATLAGCTGYSEKSNFTPPSVPLLGSLATADHDDTTATVLLSASVAGLTCAESRIVLARAEGEGFKSVQVLGIRSQYGGGEAAAVADLAPGTYHVVLVACRNGNNVVSVGGAHSGSQEVPWKTELWGRSLAYFALASGEVLDAGQLTIQAVTVKGFSQSIADRKTKVSVEASGTAALAEATRLRPDLASRLHSIPMTLAGGEPMIIFKCRLEAPDKALPNDGTSHVTDLVAQNPAAGQVIANIGSSTRDAERCVDAGAANDKLLSAAAGAAVTAVGSAAP